MKKFFLVIMMFVLMTSCLCACSKEAGTDEADEREISEEEQIEAVAPDVGGTLQGLRPGDEGYVEEDTTTTRTVVASETDIQVIYTTTSDSDLSTDASPLETETVTLIINGEEYTRSLARLDGSAWHICFDADDYYCQQSSSGAKIVNKNYGSDYISITSADIGVFGSVSGDAEDVTIGGREAKMVRSVKDGIINETYYVDGVSVCWVIDMFCEESGIDSIGALMRAFIGTFCIG